MMEQEAEMLLQYAPPPTPRTASRRGARHGESLSQTVL